MTEQGTPVPRFFGVDVAAALRGDYPVLYFEPLESMPSWIPVWRTGDPRGFVDMLTRDAERKQKAMEA